MTFSRSLAHPRPSGSADVDGRCAGAGRYASDRGRTVIGRPRKPGSQRPPGRARRVTAPSAGHRPPGHGGQLGGLSRGGGPHGGIRLPLGPGAGAGGLRHPHDHRRDVRHRPDRGDPLRPPPARCATARDDRAGRPQLRCPRLARRGRRHRRGSAGPGQARTQPAGLSPPRRPHLHLAPGRTRGPRRHRHDHRDDRARTPQRGLPADHHHPRPGLPTGRRSSRSTTSGGRSRPRTSSSSPPSWADACCAPAPRAGWGRRSTCCWSPTRPCGSRSATPC